MYVHISCTQNDNDFLTVDAVLREHALFTLHNLLKNNPENQKVVEAIKPNAEWDDAGVLKDKFTAMKIA